MKKLKIRAERQNDIKAIHELTLKAFAPMPFSNGSEAPIIDQLRNDGDLVVSRVAERNNQIIGHIAFSPVTINNENRGWYGLGPVAVDPEFQKKGVGRKLINAGLSRIKQMDAMGCVLIGDPGYYHRFGFQSDGRLIYGDIPSPFVQWLSFGAQKPSGILKYASAFEQHS